MLNFSAHIENNKYLSVVGKGRMEFSGEKFFSGGIFPEGNFLLGKFSGEIFSI